MCWIYIYICICDGSIYIYIYIYTCWVPTKYVPTYGTAYVRHRRAAGALLCKSVATSNRQ